MPARKELVAAASSALNDAAALGESYKSEAFMESQAMVTRQLKHWMVMCSDFSDRFHHINRDICPFTEEHDVPGDGQLDELVRLAIMRFTSMAERLQAPEAKG